MDQIGSSESLLKEGVKEKYAIAAEQPLDPDAALPEVYGDNRLVILPRDPLWFFAYWELTPDRIDEARRTQGEALDHAAFILRVYDVTDLDQEGVEKAPFKDIEIPRQTREWYVKGDKPGRAYIVEIGYRLTDGRFISLLRSNRIRLPGGRISEKTDSHWMAVGITQEAEWNKFLEASTGLDGGHGSSELSKIMAQRWEFLRSVFSGSSSSSISSSGRGISKDPVTPEEKV